MTFDRFCKVVLVGLFAVFDGGQPGQLSAGEIPTVAEPAPDSSTAPALQPVRPGKWAVTVLGGALNKSNFTRVLLIPWSSTFDDTRLLTGSVSRRVYDFSEVSAFGQDWFIDLEAGAGQRFGNSTATELWSAVYLKFDGFPWADKVYITAGISTGVNYATSISDHEKAKSGNDTGTHLLHYLAPEFAIANPDNIDLQLVARLHHRSGVFGLFDGVDGGSTFLTVGVRQHF